MNYKPELISGRICYVIYGDDGKPLYTESGALRYFCIEARAQEYVAGLRKPKGFPPSAPKMPAIVQLRKQEEEENSQFSGTIHDRAGISGYAQEQLADINARSGLWLPLPLTAEAKKALAEPMRKSIEKVPGGNFTTKSVIRLLARPDQDGFRVVVRLFERMMERQLPFEKATGTSVELNQVGFSSPDAGTARALANELAHRGYSPGLHARMSSILLKYARTQLPEIMNKGRIEGRNFSLRTNPNFISDWSW